MTKTPELMIATTPTRRPTTVLLLLTLMYFLMTMAILLTEPWYPIRTSSDSNNKAMPANIGIIVSLLLASAFIWLVINFISRRRLKQTILLAYGFVTIDSIAVQLLADTDMGLFHFVPQLLQGFGSLIFLTAAGAYIVKFTNRRFAASRVALFVTVASIPSGLSNIFQPDVNNQTQSSTITFYPNSPLASFTPGLISWLALVVVLLAVGIWAARTPFPTVSQETEIDLETFVVEPRWHNRRIFWAGLIAVLAYGFTRDAMGLFGHFFLGPAFQYNNDAVRQVYIFFGATISVGGLLAAWILRYFSSRSIVAVTAFAAWLLVIICINTSSYYSAGAFLLLGVCNGILFPSLLHLVTDKMRPSVTRSFAFLILATHAGIVLSPQLGTVIDNFSTSWALALLAICYGSSVYCSSLEYPHLFRPLDSSLHRSLSRLPSLFFLFFG